MIYSFAFLVGDVKSLDRKLDYVFKPSTSFDNKCPTCPKKVLMSWINDGECDEVLNTLECCFDGGDCTLKYYG